MKVIKLRKNERTSLERVVRSQWPEASRSGQAALARRARMILMSADGVSFNEIRQRLGCDVRFIQRWRERFTTDRIAGLSSQARGRPAKKVDARLEARVLRYSVTTKPADGKDTLVEPKARCGAWRCDFAQCHRTDLARTRDQTASARRLYGQQ